MPEEKLVRIDAILCHHKGDLILKAIHSLILSRGVDLRIIVATSVPEISFHSVKTLFIQGGPARKRNIAYRFTEADYIAFFDDDVEVTPTCVSEMLKVLQSNGVGMVFGKTLNMEKKKMFDEAGSFMTPTGFLWSRGDRTEDVGQFDIVEPILSGKSASCMIRKKAFVEAGFFDESYEILAEETDLSWRVWLKGWKVLFAPQSVAYHAFNTKFKPRDFYIPRRVYFNGCRNYISMLLTNLENFNFVVPVMLQAVVWFGASVGMFITGKFEAATYILKGLVYVMSHLTDILSKRKAVQSSRKVTDKELMKVIMKRPPRSYYLKRFFRYIATGLHG